ncbi:MAG: HD domain-containing protein [Pseudomonadota bacterium]|nr:HD domain-containing protein [Pseudomonadota bacterium]
MLKNFRHFFNFEELASVNKNQHAPILKFIGFALIFTAISFGFLHAYYEDVNGTLFLFSIGIMGLLALLFTHKMGLAIASQIYTAVLATTIIYFHISLDGALAPWFPLIAVAALLGSGWRSGLIWLAFSLTVLTSLYLNPIDTQTILPNFWAYVPEQHQHFDHFLIVVGAMVVITLLMTYVEVARNLAFTQLEEHRQNLETQVQIEVEKRIAETNAYEVEIESTQKELILTMSTVLETRSSDTGFHVQRVCEYSALLAKLLGLTDKEQELIFIAASMHDVGKVVISDEVLHKPGKLTAEEFQDMQRHTQVGYEMLKGSTRPIIQTAAVIALYHHEWWNVQGYPKQLKGEEIPLYARIVAIADVFDALGSKRAYKESWPIEDIFSYFENGSGKQFDPRLVDLLLTHSEQFLDIRNRLMD